MKIFLITGLLFTAVSVVLPQQVTVNLSTPGVWVAGKANQVDIKIGGAAGTGPCRMVQSFPAGFDIRPLELAGGDIFFENNTLNIVWSLFPPGTSVTISYEAVPEKSTAGEVDIEGDFYFITRLNSRSIAEMPPVNVMVSVTPAGTGQATTQEARRDQAVREQATRAEVSGGPVYRVQVLSSSSRMSDDQLMKRLGVNFNEKVTINEAGSIFRYQVGECSDYGCALLLLEKFSKAGVQGAFIVAFLNDRQITIEQARNSGK
ncbi:MAG: hypothetical protein IH591_08490 [Bacteroidales bacterium]|nr:hypothetical protein [Bacteroidales bacterium]